MNYIVDTHILLWYMLGDRRVTPDVRRKLEDVENTVYISNASLWEIAIKESIGKLKLNCSLNDLNEYLNEKGIKIIEFDFDDLETLKTLPLYHQDPFDRLIISQVKTKIMEIITNDNQILKYFS